MSKAEKSVYGFIIPLIVFATTLHLRRLHTISYLFRKIKFMYTKKNPKDQTQVQIVYVFISRPKNFNSKFTDKIPITLRSVNKKKDDKKKKKCGSSLDGSSCVIFYFSFKNKTYIIVHLVQR